MYRQLKALVEQAFKIKLGKSTLTKTLARLEFTLKKVRYQKAAHFSEVVLTLRKAWADAYDELDGEYYLVFLDEQPWGLQPKRTLGWAKIGAAAMAMVPTQSNNAKATLVCAVSPDFGLVHSDVWWTSNVTADCVMKDLAELAETLAAVKSAKVAEHERAIAAHVAAARGAKARGVSEPDPPAPFMVCDP